MSSSEEHGGGTDTEPANHSGSVKSKTVPSSVQDEEEDDDEEESSYVYGPESTMEDDEEHVISFSSYQLFVFVACYLGYGVVLYNRKSFTFTLPHIITEQYFSSYEVGMILSAQAVTYTVSKFVFSWAADVWPPRYMFAGGLFFTGFVMLAFSDQEDWPNIMLLTAANGLAQGLGWPAVSKIIRAWYPPTQYGFWFATLTTATSFVNSMGPSIATFISITYGWRVALQIPALIAILSSVVIPYCTWDKPSDVGYEDQLTLGGAERGHWSDLTGSQFMHLLVTSFCLLFVVKTTCQEWGIVYLHQERGLSYYAATSFLPALEIGGLIGSILMGALTDFMIRRGYFFGTGRSPRMAIVQFCVAGSCLTLNLFVFSISPETVKVYMTTLGFWMGFCINGAISLLGTVAVEIAPIHMTGAAQAITGLAANFGNALGGLPISYAASSWGWFASFMTVNIICLFVFFILVVGKDVKATYLQDAKSGPPRLRKYKKSISSSS